MESTLRSKGKKIKNCIISNDNTKIQSNCNNLFSKIENKLQLVQFLYTTAPRYAKINEDCELYVCREFDDHKMFYGMAFYCFEYLN